MPNPVSRIESALKALQAGQFIIICDDENRENEGDLTFAAEKVTPQHINFMVTHARGLICISMASKDLDRLAIPMMVLNNTSKYKTGFTVSVEAATGVSTGVSAYDRARTIEVLSDPKSGPADLVMPGHTFPLRACDGGVLERIGQTEASMDLVKLAKLRPAAVICEIMNEDGSMSRQNDLALFSKKHDIPIVHVSDVITYRKEFFKQTQCEV